MGIKREIQLIVLLLAVIFLLAGAVHFFTAEAAEADASKFVMEDLQSKYPDADISIMSIRQKQNAAGANYFEVKAKATLEPATPCPERIHIYYNYPEQNFVSQPKEYITRNCEVCAEGICMLAFPEEAVIASHTFEATGNVAAYLSEYPSATAMTSEGGDSWTVTWDSPLAPMYYVIELGKDGAILSVERVDKQL